MIVVTCWILHFGFLLLFYFLSFHFFSSAESTDELKQANRKIVQLESKIKQLRQDDQEDEETFDAQPFVRSEC